MGVTRRQFRTAHALARLTVLALMLGGCAQFQPGVSVADNANFTSIEPDAVSDSDLSIFLDQAVEQSLASFETTPWGPHAEVQLVQRYLAASGRDCVRLKVSPAAAATRSALACRKDQQWQVVQPLPQMSRF